MPKLGNPFAAFTEQSEMLICVRRPDGKLFWIGGVGYATVTEREQQFGWIDGRGFDMSRPPQVDKLSVHLNFHEWTGEWTEGRPDIDRLESGQLMLPIGQEVQPKGNPVVEMLNQSSIDDTQLLFEIEEDDDDDGDEFGEFDDMEPYL